MNIKIQERERKLLIKVAIVILVAAVFPNVADDYVLNYMHKQAQEKTRLEKSVKSYENRLSGIEGERKILRRFVDEYRNLVSRNVIDDPDLVDLIKKMKEINKERNFFKVDYSFLDSHQFGPEASIYTKNSSVGVNILPMKVEMGMLHDLDIFMFIESLSEKIDHVSYPVECTLKRVQENFALVNRENMMANCTIAWYWVNDPERAGEEGDSETAALSQ